MLNLFFYIICLSLSYSLSFCLSISRPVNLSLALSLCLSLPLPIIPKCQHSESISPKPAANNTTAAAEKG